MDREVWNQELNIVGSDPGSAASQRCDLGQVTYPLCTSVSPAATWDEGSTRLAGLWW